MVRCLLFAMLSCPNMSVGVNMLFLICPCVLVSSWMARVTWKRERFVATFTVDLPDPQLMNQAWLTERVEQVETTPFEPTSSGGYLKKRQGTLMCQYV